MKKLFIVIVSSFMLISCGESSRSSNFTPSESSYSTDGSGYESTDNTNEEDNQPVSQMVTCPMCSGSGVFEFMPGDVMAPRTTWVQVVIMVVQKVPHSWNLKSRKPMRHLPIWNTIERCVQVLLFDHNMIE